MKAALLVVLLVVVSMSALPALATSIPPPVISTSFSGVDTAGSFFNSPTDYKIGGTNSFQGHFCSSNCVEFEVQSTPGCGTSTCSPFTNFAEVGGFTSGGVGGELFGHLGRVSFNSATDILTAVFGGKEQVAFVSGKQFPLYWYTVEGIFTENLGTGVGSVHLTSEKFIGTTAVPEPSTLLTLGTGLCAMSGIVRRKLMSR